MSSLSNYILSPVNLQQRTTDRLGAALQISPEAFPRMVTRNGLDRRIGNPWLVEACATALQDAMPTSRVTIGSVHVERKSLCAINMGTRQLVELSDVELLATDVNNLIASRAIVTVDVQGLDAEFRPTLAINISPEGEEVAFGTTVDICTNFTIFSADRRFSTFQRHRDRTRPRLTTNDLLTQINGLIQSTEDILEGDLQEIDALRHQPVTRSQWHELAGELFTQVHYVNRQRLARNISALSAEEKALPVTASLLADIVAEAKQPTHEVYAWDGELSNRRNLVNFGTEQIKLRNAKKTK
jgi:hypothetical protein